MIRAKLYNYFIIRNNNKKNSTIQEGDGITSEVLDYVDINVEDLAGIYSEVAQQIGVDNAYKLYLYFRGQQLSFPLKFVSKEYIAKKMIEEYNGSNVRELARKYGYTDSYIRQILKKIYKS